MFFVVVFMIVVFILLKINSRNKRENNKKRNVTTATLQPPQEFTNADNEQFQTSDPCVKTNSGKSVSLIDIPVEIMPNLYSLELNHVTIKHHITYNNGKKDFDYVTLKCEAKYQLNGHRAGKRSFIFTSFDALGNIIDIYGSHKTYRLNESGYEVLEVCFDNCDRNMPHSINVSVRDVLDNRTP